MSRSAAGQSKNEQAEEGDDYGGKTLLSAGRMPTIVC